MISSASLPLSTIGIVGDYKPELILIVFPRGGLSLPVPVACGWEKRIEGSCCIFFKNDEMLGEALEFRPLSLGPWGDSGGRSGPFQKHLWMREC